MSATDKINKVMLVAGETSGDQHGANLAKALQKTDQPFQLSGMGMAEMQAANVHILEDSQDIAVIGFIEVLKHYPRIKRAFTHLTKCLREDPPDLLILIDYPGFNLRLARYAHQLGIKTLFYISPQVWAWNRSRIHQIAQIIDVMAVVFPFEVAIYEKTGIPVHYVGHPLVDEAITAGVLPVKQIAIHEMKNILLLPGSRYSEMKKLLPILCKTAELLSAHREDLHFSMLLAPDIDQNRSKATVAQYDFPCKFYTDNYAAMQNAGLAITASGTATLQLALCGTPMVVIYKLSWFTYYLMKLMIKTPYIALPNIIAKKQIVPELIQHKANPKFICKTALTLLNDPALLRTTRSELITASSLLGNGKTSDKLAAVVCQMLRKDKKH